MANISSASGTIEMRAKSRRIIKILFDSFDRRKGDYSTNFNDEFDNLKIEKEEDEYICRDGFWAGGRWAYTSNIENYPNRIKNVLSNEEIKALEENYWEIIYRFTDEECGCGVLYEALVVNIHKPNCSIDDLSGFEILKHSDYTWWNLVSLDYYDSIADYVSNTYCIENDKDEAERFFYDFERNRSQLAECYGCRKEDTKAILNKCGLEEIYKKALSIAIE